MSGKEKAGMAETPVVGRRNAYATFVDDNYFDGFVALVKSLVLNNPDTQADLIVLHDGLLTKNFARARSLWPDVKFVRVDPAPYESYVKGDESNYLYIKAYFILDAFRLRGYDRVVTLDTDMIVLGPIDELFDLEQEFSAVPQFFDSEGGRKLNSGLLAFGPRYMSDEFEARLDEIGRTGAYELDRHDQGVLTAALDGEYHALPREFNWVKRASGQGVLPPDNIRILHFTGAFKPWQGGEIGYTGMEALWHDYNISDISFFCRYLQRTEGATGRRDLLDHYGSMLEGIPQESRERLAAATGAVTEEARRLSAAGNFSAALAVHRCLAAQTARLQDPVAVAKLLRALSRYEDATVLAKLAAAVDDGTVDADYFLAETAWILRDHASAQEHVGRALEVEPTHVKARALRRRIALGAADALVSSTTHDEGLSLSHAAFYVDELGNYGDELLPVAVRESIAAVRPVRSWTGVHVHQVFDAQTVAQVNETDALVVGGGGLFLPDTMPNGNSGWQWNVPDESLRALKVPLALTAVGFNLFEGQQIHGSRFTESLRLTVETAQLVGLRNHGSIERVRDLLPSGLRDKVVYMPCPTTFLGLLDHGPATRIDRTLDGVAPTIHLNVAFDRASLRFKDTYGEFLAQIDRFVRTVDFAEVRIAAHTVGDERIAQDLYSEHGTRVPVDSLFRLGVDGALELYAKSNLVIGMRGHAGMIPFGVGTPILSLVSHPKLRYFLEDIGHEEWGVSVQDEHLADRLREMASDVVAQPERYRSEVSDARVLLRKSYNEALGTFIGAI